MAVSDVIPQDGGPGNVKLHPYLITLVRWCVSCLWSTATVFLHRLMTTPLPQITASKPPPRATLKPRQASTDHLHPEPRVECVVLHTPDTPTLDVIFVHGLYGSLGNTWRQGEWRTKYKLDPTKVPLRNHTKEPCNCIQNKPDNIYNNIQEIYSYEAELNETKLNERLNGCFKKILPNENSLITEKFYNNTLIEVEVNNFETQAKFVTELFKNCDKNCDIDTFKCNCENRETKCDLNEKLNECRCKLNVSGVKCRAGCGCVCDECYSPCWPKDWIKEDFPGARVISINYTSDPYLWRPLWVKGNKRLRLHERADQMMEQLLQLGVGQRPIIWVGHSKGGLFIKQIYCEAYEAYLKMDKSRKAETTKTIANNNFEDQSNRQYNKNNVINNIDNNYNRCNDNEIVHIRNNNQNELFNNFVNNHSNGYTANGGTSLRNIDEMNQIRNNDNSGNEFDENTDFLDISIRNDEKLRIIEENMNEVKNEVDFGSLSSNHEEDSSALSLRASLWRASSGFMFYSVPHRGSPLADIKTPITSRSVELQEIAKDCPLVLALQDRWLVATQTSRPLVRSLVETCKTLMSVLWLRIVSEDSADAGVGSLHGVSVDHREICKPSSRTCLLYTELTELIQGALSKCDCQ